MTEETNGPAQETLAEGQEAPTTQTEAQQTEAPASQEKAGEQEAGAEEGQEQQKESEKPKRSGTQRAKIREQYLRSELAEAQRKIEALEARQKSEPEIGPPPKEEDFKGDYFAYQAELNAYNIRKAIREEKARDAEAQRESLIKEARREIEIAHQERVAEAMDPESEAYIADYAEVMAKMKGINVAEDVAYAIVESDKSALLAYHLANHPEKLRELNGLTGTRLARAIGRLEGEVRRPAARKQTTAPAPLTQVKGSASPVKSDFDLAKSEDVSELIKAWRTKKSA